MIFNKPTKHQHFSTPTNEQLSEVYSSRYNQKQKILKILIIRGSLSTIQARQFGIMSPAPRIKELREAGHTIHTIQDWALKGVATYYLIKLAKPKAKAVPND